MKKCIACGAKFDSIDWKCRICQRAPAFIEGYPAFSRELAASADGFKVEYFAQLARLEAGNFWFCSRNRLILWAIRQYFSGASNFFEIGCGTGFVLSAVEKAFPHFSLYGSDIYVEGLKFAKGRLRQAVLLQMDARKIPFEDEFDVIGAFDILEHVKEDSLVLSQMHQALRKGGGIILTVPQHNFLWSQFDEASCHLRRYNAAELKAKVKDSGFEMIKMTSFVSLLLPFMLISRLRVSKDYDIMKALKFNPSINAFLGKMLDLERLLIRLGARLPFGGSLLLIARKR